MKLFKESGAKGRRRKEKGVRKLRRIGSWASMFALRGVYGLYKSQYGSGSNSLSYTQLQRTFILVGLSKYCILAYPQALSTLQHVNIYESSLPRSLLMLRAALAHHLRL